MPATYQIVLIIVWFGVGAALAYRFIWGSTMSSRSQWLIGTATLLAGPVFFPAWLLTNTIVLVSEEEMSVRDALRQQLGRTQEAAAEDQPASSNDKSFVLQDTEGRSISERAAKGKGVWLNLTSDLLSQAVGEKASDVLIDPTETDYNIRYRVNGTLRSVRHLNEVEGKSVVNSIKALAGMNIAERRRPQDGAFSAQTPRGSISFRVASAGVVNGEKISIRVLDQGAASYGLDDVGLSLSEAEIIKSALARQQGMILVCGPTGSGKSSTVHAMLRTIDSVQRNIITIEDPVEYVIPNASQIEINTKAGITFASVLRSVLRQDPDVISVGEIRDSETAEIALQAAQTGHLVFATVHSGSNVGALLRLADLGVEEQLIASAVNLVISQRLVRKLCDHCKAPAEYSLTQQRSLREQQIDPSLLFSPQGCEHCYKTGFGSRTGVFDIMVVDHDLREQITRGQLSVNEGHQTGPAGMPMSTMQVRAIQLALTGIIPWEEALKLGASTD
ncbi:MAG: GspE/PulE family protein [Planctomycetota bacterium]